MKLRVDGGAALRIGYLTTHYPSVSHTFIQGEIADLPKHGIDVVRMALNPPRAGDLLTPLDRAEASRTFYVKSPPLMLAVARLSAIALRHPRALLRVARRAVRGTRWNLALAVKTLAQLAEALLVWRHCRLNDVTAIHAHFGQAPASVAWLTAQFGNAVGHGRWTWSVTLHGWHEFVIEDTARLREKTAAADLLVAVSDYTRAQLIRISPTSELSGKIHVIRCGIDFAAFPLRATPPRGGTPIVVTVARLSAEKGHLVLLEALAELRTRGLEVGLRVIGTGPFAGELRTAADRLGIADAVHFEGALAPDAVADALRRADVFCLPTLAEGLPVSIMEAMAVGIPVVTTYIAGIPELVIDGSTGWVVPAGSVRALSDALVNALLGGSRTSAIVRSAAIRVRERHCRTETVAELAGLLHQTHGTRR